MTGAIDRGVVAAHEPCEASLVGDDGACVASLVGEGVQPTLSFGGRWSRERGVLVGVGHREQVLAVGESLRAFNLGAEAGG